MTPASATRRTSQSHGHRASTQFALSATIAQQQDVILSLISERSALEARVRAVEKIVEEQSQVLTSSSGDMTMAATAASSAGSMGAARPSAPPLSSEQRRTPPPSYEDIGTDQVWHERTS